MASKKHKTYHDNIAAIVDNIHDDPIPIDHVSVWIMQHQNLYLKILSDIPNISSDKDKIQAYRYADQMLKNIVDEMERLNSGDITPNTSQSIISKKAAKVFDRWKRNT